MSISIIIPAYNASAFIAETIKSALAQTLLADDILVVNDGTTDDTAAIAAKFPHPVRVLSIANCKQGAARNFGISQVKTEWIAFLDADDLWEPNKLARQMEELAKCTSADVCYTGHRMFRMGQSGIDFFQDVPAYPATKIRESLLEGCTFLPSSAVIRRSAILSVGGFSPGRFVAEDWDLWLRLLHAGSQFTACPELLLLYRIHGQNQTSHKFKLLQENTRVWREQILPFVSGKEKIKARRNLGHHSADIAYMLRPEGDPRWSRAMVASIIQWPFGRYGRYKALLFLLLSSLSPVSGRSALGRFGKL